MKFTLATYLLTSALANATVLGVAPRDNCSRDPTVAQNMCDGHSETDQDGYCVTIDGIKEGNLDPNCADTAILCATNGTTSYIQCDKCRPRNTSNPHYAFCTGCDPNNSPEGVLCE